MAIADANDVNHPAAVAFQSQMSGPRRLIVTNYILDELYTLILMDLGYRQAVAIKQKLDILGAGHLLETIWIDASLGTEAWTVFERYNSDKQWSFTDCVSNVVMKGAGCMRSSRSIIILSRWASFDFPNRIY